MTPDLPPAPYYQVSGFGGASWAEGLPLGVLVRTLRDRLEEAGVERVARRSPDGTLTPVVPHDPGGPRLRDLRPVELVALYVGADDELRGAEWDLLVALHGQTWRVTVWSDGDGLVVQSAPALQPRPAVEAPTVAELVARWDLLELEADGREWTADALWLVDQALALLTAEERAAIGPLRFRRRADPEASPMFYDDGQRRDSPQPAQLRLDAQGACVDLFDSALDGWRATFVGTPPDPHAPQLLLLAHELGHAVAARGQPRRGALSPVEAAYAAVAGAANGPTRYGRRSPTEGFAEAFALYKVDPDALRRALPEVHAWFVAGGHLP
jgi:hypothetical protein